MVEGYAEEVLDRVGGGRRGGGADEPCREDVAGSSAVGVGERGEGGGVEDAGEELASGSG